jgi:hypothetical protein
MKTTGGWQQQVASLVAATILFASGCIGNGGRGSDRQDVVSRHSALGTDVPCHDANGQPTPCEGPGGVRRNGTNTQPARIRADSVAAAGVPGNFFTGVGFLFEPESPYASL